MIRCTQSYVARAPLARASRCLALMLSLATLLGAGTDAHFPSQMAVRVFADNDGLPQRSVYALARDTRGGIWAGTMAGVVRYDGLRWRLVETPASPRSLYVNSNAMTAFSDGSVWVGTRYQGLLEYREGRWRVHGPGTGLPADNVNMVLEDSETDRRGRHVAWVVTYGKGLWRLADDAWTAVGPSAGIRDQRLFCLMMSRHESRRRFRVGGREGIWVGDGQRFKPFEGGRLPDPCVRALAETRDPDGTPSLWIGMEKGGLARWKNGRLECLDLKHFGGSNNVRSLVTESRPGGDALWVCTYGGGVGYLKDGQWLWVNRNAGLPTDDTRCALLTQGGREGRMIWIGSDSFGVMRCTGSSWRRLKLPAGVDDPRVQCFFQTSNHGEQTLWLGSNTKGLLCFRNGRPTHYQAGRDVPMESVRAIYGFPGEDEVFLGTFQGLCSFRPGRLRLYTPADGLPAAQIRALAGSRDAKGRRILWIGTSRGLASWDGRAFTMHPSIPGDPESSVRCVVPEGERIWVGTDTGLACFQEGRWRDLHILPKLHGLSVWGVQPVLSGPQKGLWIGTLGSGLFFAPDPAGSDELHVTTTQSFPWFPSDAVNGIAADLQGRIYVSTTRGIARLWLQDGQLQADGYSLEDGMPCLDCIGGSLYADPSGTVWVSTQEGPAFLDATDPAVPLSPRPLTWLSAQAGAKAMRPGDELGARTVGITMEARLWTYHRETDNLYRSQLVGLQPEPGEWTPEPFVRMPGLPPGHYVLRMWGRDWTGVASGPIEFPFTVCTPLWRRPWVLAGYVVLLGLGVMGFHRMRVRILAQHNLQLEARVQEATREILLQKQVLEELNVQKNQFLGIVAHDLRNPLGAIVLAAELLEEEEDLEEVHRMARKMHEEGMEMSTLIARFLEVAAIESGTIKAEPEDFDVILLARHVLENHAPRAREKGIELRVLSPVEAATVRADVKFTREVLDNLLSNAVKFSPTGKTVSLRIQPGEGGLVLSLEDQGPGFTPEDRKRIFQRFARLSARPTGGEKSTGLGLSIVKHMVDAMGAEIWLDSEAGAGAVFRIRFPVPTP